VLGKRRPAKKKQDEENTYEVDNILGHRGSQGAYEYLVKWKGYTMADSSWVPANDFHSTQCIRDYWKASNYAANATDGSGEGGKRRGGK